MKEMQFTAMVLMSMLTLTLVFLLPRRAERDRSFVRSRWLMAGGMALLAVQFLLQYVFGFREMGVTQAVMINLLFFIPTSVLMSLALISLQCQGRLSWKRWMPGLVAYALTVLPICWAAVITGDVLSGSEELQRAEYLSSFVYLIMQLYYSYVVKKGNDRLDEALKNYYDRYMGNLLDWLRRAVNILILIAIFAPLLIFSTGWILTAYALLIFFSIYYLVFSFICYGVSNDSRRIQVAEQNAVETKRDELQGNPVFADGEKKRIERAVERWLAAGGHLHCGITMPIAASEIGVPRYLLSAWLKTTDDQLFNPWLTHLRIDEAKRQLLAHPDWQSETIAERCGFSSRTYFQTVFKKHTGMSPTEFIELEDQKNLP
jgi:AraC-like DNA-binding protein